MTLKLHLNILKSLIILKHFTDILYVLRLPDIKMDIITWQNIMAFPRHHSPLKDPCIKFTLIWVGPSCWNFAQVEIRETGLLKQDTAEII